MLTLKSETRDAALWLTLSRPERRNALDAELVAELGRAVATADPELRAVVLQAEGEVYCSGADLEWLRQSAELSEHDNREHAQRLASMFRTLDECPLPVIACVTGNAWGGGLGLLACADIALGSSQASFGFPEVRLGMAPAVVAPFVIRRIGASQARRWFLSGEQFDASQALHMGLLHEVVPPERLHERCRELVADLCANGPRAVRAAKRLIREMSQLHHDRDTALERAAIISAHLRASPEGQEGIRAFLEKREPRWS